MEIEFRIGVGSLSFFFSFYSSAVDGIGKDGERIKIENLDNRINAVEMHPLPASPPSLHFRFIERRGNKIFERINVAAAAAYLHLRL